ncbi:hypothetical protein [Thiomicrospira sp. WB1]|uniref:hypothetical protein n=1 Tax=Thiomicrospira sp. WB1 TaxID=1685380 RepID=UPI0007483735|nr:hypothetical protein [Thiomicrospira sp. WB1]KUJ72087.1 hypothetical protein AVO41_06535 [Thiomicrospira sp. WB1]
MRMSTLSIGLLASVSLLSTQTQASSPHPGKVLHDDANCMKCHADMGYAKPSLKKMGVDSWPALKKAVSYCESNLNVGWFPEEQEQVADYLNQEYYHFDK